MFHFDRGLKLTRADLAIDIRRRQPRAFISHAHADHMARHQFALCTPDTARLYQFRFGRRDVRELPYRQPIEWGGLRLTTYPAGHCLGSAMLLAEDGDHRFLYTGDFKLGESATAERAELPRADILVMECTFGHPRYRLPPRSEAVQQLLDLVRQSLAGGATPVIQAYALGKGQELTRVLTSAGIPVMQHREVFEVSRVYEACGLHLGRYLLYPGRPLEGHALIVPPGKHRRGCLPGLKKQVHFTATGWAMDDATTYRWGVDHAIPLSDHAGYDELFAAVEQVAPREIYCTHGPDDFAERLRDAGFNAYTLGARAQLRLFA